jgi:hypothetical protein
VARSTRNSRFDKFLLRGTVHGSVLRRGEEGDVKFVDQRSFGSILCTRHEIAERNDDYRREETEEDVQHRIDGYKEVNDQNTCAGVVGITPRYHNKSPAYLSSSRNTTTHTGDSTTLSKV